MSARQTVKDALAGLVAAGLPLLDARLPENITKATLVLGVTKVEPGPVSRQRTWTLWLAVLTQHQSTGVDDALEETLGSVLDALDHARPSPLNWTAAQRQPVKDDAYHAYVIDVTVIMQED